MIKILKMQYGLAFAKLICILAVFLLISCAPKYEPVALQLSQPAIEKPQEGFFHELINHLAYRRDYAFAMQYYNKNFIYNGWHTTEDGREIVYLLRSAQKVPTPFVLAPYAFIHIAVGEDAYLKAEHSATLLLKNIDDGDGLFKGTYKLTVMNARYCSGETKEVPVLSDDGVYIEAYERLIRISMYDEMIKYITPTYCQGLRNSPSHPALNGVRFYFDDLQSMEKFAFYLKGVFPWLEVR